MIANDTRPGPPNSVMLLCPVNGCPWRHQRIDDAIRRDEDAARAHLAEHPIEDFLRTIAELRDEWAAR